MDSCKISKWEVVLGAPDRVNISDDFTNESKYGFDIPIITKMSETVEPSCI